MTAGEMRRQSATILLLMKRPEAEFCADILSKHRDDITIRWAWDRTSLDTASHDISGNGDTARLIAFSTSVIVPEIILKRFGGNAYNFHPGPPEFPGNRPSIFATYKAAREFGVTLHVMTKRVDDGPINAVTRFDRRPFQTGDELAIEAYKRLAKLFIDNVDRLTTVETPIPVLPNERWAAQKTRYEDVNRMRRIPRDGLPREELERRFRAAGWIYSPLA